MVTENRKFFLLLFVLSILLSGLGIFVVNAMNDIDDGEDARNIKFYSYSNGAGAGGYDVVAYFEQNEAVAGDAQYESNFAGLPWLFSSAANRDKFVADPARYLPQYGGHCAYGVASGYLVRGDPTAWTIHDGRLYFNYNKGIRNAWLADAANFVSRSENNWRQLSQ